MNQGKYLKTKNKFGLFKCPNVDDINVYFPIAQSGGKIKGFNKLLKIRNTTWSFLIGERYKGISFCTIR